MDNKNIKEILDKLQYIKKTNINHPLLNNLSVQEVELILDYITNLQKENERLKKGSDKDCTD